MLTLENISCSYNNSKIFKGLSAKVKRGNLLILKGDNGSGKTSLLKIIANLKKPSSGKISWHENDEENSIKNLQTCYIGHKLAIKTDFTVYENILFWAKMYEGEQYAEYALKFFGLEEKRNVNCSSLSAGWIKKVALAKLICCPSDMWLLDEPFNNLDKNTIEKLNNLILAKCSKGGVVILSSHLEIDNKEAIEINMLEY